MTYSLSYCCEIWSKKQGLFLFGDFKTSTFNYIYMLLFHLFLLRAHTYKEIIYYPYHVNYCYLLLRVCFWGVFMSYDDTFSYCRYTQMSCMLLLLYIYIWDRCIKYFKASMKQPPFGCKPPTGTQTKLYILKSGKFGDLHAFLRPGISAPTVWRPWGRPWIHHNDYTWSWSENALGWRGFQGRKMSRFLF